MYSPDEQLLQVEHDLVFDVRLQPLEIYSPEEIIPSMFSPSSTASIAVDDIPLHNEHVLQTEF